MKKLIFNWSVIGILSCIILAACASQSLGEKRAKQVIKKVESGITGPELQQMINRDGEELKGQDLLDYYEVLQQYGVF